MFGLFDIFSLCSWIKSNSIILTHSIKFEDGTLRFPLEIKLIQEDSLFCVATNCGYFVPNRFTIYPATYWAACDSSWENESFAAYGKQYKVINYYNQNI